MAKQELKNFNAEMTVSEVVEALDEVTNDALSLALDNAQGEATMTSEPVTITITVKPE